MYVKSFLTRALDTISLIRESDSMITSERIVNALGEYRQEVSSSYDEVLAQVAQRAADVGELGKLDITALTGWKRLNASTRWMSALMSTPDSEVRTITKEAVAKANDGTCSTPAAATKARGVLAALPGFHSGDALASAVLLAAAPRRMAVYDRRAHTGLSRLGYVLTNAPGRYGRYMKVIDQIREECRSARKELTARDVDLALYWIGKQ